MKTLPPTILWMDVLPEPLLDGPVTLYGDILLPENCCDNLLINSMDGERNSVDGAAFSNWYKCSKFN